MKWISLPADVQELVRHRAAYQRKAAPLEDPKLVARERDGHLVSLEGEIGEWVIADRLGLAPHRLNAHGGDRGVDFGLPEGRTLSVKSTRHVGGVLLYQSPGDFITDIAALVYVDAERMRGVVRGWTTRRVFMRDKQPFERGRLGTEVCMRPGALAPVELLVRWIEDRKRRTA